MEADEREATTPDAIHMAFRMKIAHGVHKEMETTVEAEPTMTNPITQSSATTTKRTVESASSRPATRTSGRRRPAAAVVAGGPALDRGRP